MSSSAGATLAAVALVLILGGSAGEVARAQRLCAVTRLRCTLRLGLTLLALAVAASSAGCGSSESSQGGETSAGSGVEGTVTVGPTCPGPSIVNDSRDCTEPLATELQLIDLATGNEVARTNSDDQGHFRVNLPPGEYRLSATGDTGATTSVEVSVHSQRYSNADLLVDSGVR